VTDAETYDLVVRNVRPFGGEPVDLGARGGTWAAIGNGLMGRAVVEGRGRLALPGLVDGHMHLDKTLIGMPWIPHIPGGTVRERVAAEKKIYADLPRGSLRQRAARLADLALRHGTTTIRCHVDVDTDRWLDGLIVLLDLREQYRDRLKIQLVAFPQSGVLSQPGMIELLGAAIKEGADLVGGLDPVSFDGDLDGHLDAIFGVAERHGVGLDIHLHEPGEMGAQSLEAIAARTRALGLGGKVNVSHAFALGDLQGVRLLEVAEQLALAGVSILTNAPGARPFPPPDTLLEAGVTIMAGSDNIRDPWQPYGSADQLERAMLVAYRMGWRHDGGLETAARMVTDLAATGLGLPAYGIAVGVPADLVLVDAGTVAEAVVSRPPREVIVKGRSLASLPPISDLASFGTYAR
jgi:cytosine deaminase